MCYVLLSVAGSITLCIVSYSLWQKTSHYYVIFSCSQRQEASHYVLCPILSDRKHIMCYVLFSVAGTSHYILCPILNGRYITLCFMSYSQWQETSHYVLCPILSDKKHIMYYVLFSVARNITLCVMSYSQWQETSHYVFYPIFIGRKSHIMYYFLFSVKGKVTLHIIYSTSSSSQLQKDTPNVMCLLAVCVAERITFHTICPIDFCGRKNHIVCNLSSCCCIFVCLLLFFCDRRNHISLVLLFSVAERITFHMLLLSVMGRSTLYIICPLFLCGRNNNIWQNLPSCSL